ncbi:MAG TPA: PIN domain-containing protein [Myxococcota bacterium]|nr:PIN domain-containing protein [Myxococcota bacterium]
MRALVDSDILIWHLRGAPAALKFFRRLAASDYELWTGALQRAEVVFFMKPGEEEETCLFLSRFKTTSIDQSIVDAAGKLYRRFNPSHGIDVNDAVLAATAMLKGGKIFTLNLKHYPAPNILVEQGWRATQNVK